MTQCRKHRGYASQRIVADYLWADGQDLDDVRSRAAYWQGCLMSAAECIGDLDAPKAAS